MEELTKKRNERLAVLFDAYGQLMRAMHGEGNLAFERHYMNLYKDILSHEEFWFEYLYHIDFDPRYAEFSVGVLGTLATTLRQRGEVEKSYEVLQLDKKVLKRYQEMTDKHGSPPQVDCCRGLTYKYNLIAVNACSQLSYKDEAVEAFRQAVRFEIDENYSFAEQNLAFFLFKFANTDDYLSQSVLEQASDDQIWDVLSEQAEQSLPPPKNVILRRCDFCAQEEELLGDLQVCSRCKEYFYCSRDCQKAHWRESHKEHCCNGTVNVSDEVIMAAAEQMTEYYASVIRTHLGRTVSQEHKKKALSAVRRFIKVLLVSTMSEFNSCVGFMDTYADPHFSMEIDKFFIKQEGFEDLEGKLNRPSISEWESILNVKRTSTLMVDEETLVVFCTSLANQIVDDLKGGNASENQKKELTDAVFTLCKEIMLRKPEYNSNRGFKKMTMEDNEFKDRVFDMANTLL